MYIRVYRYIDICIRYHLITQKVLKYRKITSKNNNYTKSIRYKQVSHPQHDMASNKIT